MRILARECSLLCLLLIGLQPLQRQLCFCPAPEPPTEECHCCAEQIEPRHASNADLPRLRISLDACSPCPTKLGRSQHYQPRQERPTQADLRSTGALPLAEVVPLTVPAPSDWYEPQHCAAVLGPRSPPSL